ncbi:MAG: hypothetical protein Q9222_004983 [Ikaeria aurantiellina]
MRGINVAHHGASRHHVRFYNAEQAVAAILTDQFGAASSCGVLSIPGLAALSLPTSSVPSRFSHNITVPSLGVLRLNCFIQPARPSRPLPTVDLGDCYTAIQYLLRGDKAMAPMHFTEDRRTGFKVPFSWGHDSCQIVIKNNVPNAQDTFPMVLIAHIAAEIIEACVFETPAKLGGETDVGGHDQFSVIVASTGAKVGDWGVQFGDDSGVAASVSKREPILATIDGLREIQDAYSHLVEPSTSRSAHSSQLSSASPILSTRSAAEWCTTGNLEGGRAATVRITYGAKKGETDSQIFLDREDEEEVTRPRKRKRRTSSSGSHRKASLARSNGEDGESSSSFNGLLRSDISIQVDEHGKGISHDSAIPIARLGSPMFRYSGSTEPFQRNSSQSSSFPRTELATSSSGAVNPRSGVPADDHENLESPQSEVLEFKQSTKRALADNDSPKISLGDEIPPSSSAPAESPIKRARMDGRSRQSVASINHKDLDDGQDELSIPEAASAASKGKKSRSSKKKEKPTAKSSTNISRMNEPDLDDAMPDLPTESYQPRPSRSRSALVAEDLTIPTDFSKKPETVAKSEAKLKQTRFKHDVDFDISASDSIAQDESQTQKPDLDVSETKPQSDILENNGLPIKPYVREHSPEKHVQRNSGTTACTEDSPPRPPPSKKTRGRPKKQITSEPSATHATEESILIREDNPPESRDPIGPVPDPTPAKRGRKRKKLPMEECSKSSARDASPQADASHETEETEAAKSSVLKETDSNIQPEHSFLDEDLGLPISKSSPLPHGSPDVGMTKSDSKVAQSKQAIGPVAAKSFETKSIYRVGLSKRHRIAPLLRIGPEAAKAELPDLDTPPEKLGPASGKPLERMISAQA